MNLKIEKRLLRSGILLNWSLGSTTIITDKIRKLSRLKTQEDGEKEDALIGCGREYGGCGGGRAIHIS